MAGSSNKRKNVRKPIERHVLPAFFETKTPSPTAAVLRGKPSPVPITTTRGSLGAIASAPIAVDVPWLKIASKVRPPSVDL